jgi:FMN phosphatase YigB (HAD superfamily)
MILFFDLFNTIYDISAVPKEHLIEYRRLIDQFLETGKYEPLDMGQWWQLIKPFPEVIESLKSLDKRNGLVTLSNCPVDWQFEINRSCKLDSWLSPAILLDYAQIYKPHVGAYYMAIGYANCFDRRPADCMMVTANKTFGDLENAAKVGMQSFHVDREHGGTLWDLVKHLEQHQ